MRLVRVTPLDDADEIVSRRLFVVSHSRVCLSVDSPPAAANTWTNLSWKSFKHLSIIEFRKERSCDVVEEWKEKEMLKVDDRPSESSIDSSWMKSRSLTTMRAHFHWATHNQSLTPDKLFFFATSQLDQSSFVLGWCWSRRHRCEKKYIRILGQHKKNRSKQEFQLFLDDENNRIGEKNYNRIWWRRREIISYCKISIEFFCLLNEFSTFEYFTVFSPFSPYSKKKRRQQLIEWKWCDLHSASLRV